MELLPSGIAKNLPKLYTQESKGNNAIAYVKFFDPCSNWTWYVLEYDGDDTFFGLVKGHETEMGYFSKGELEAYRNMLGLGIERDVDFKPVVLRHIYDY